MKKLISAVSLLVVLLFSPVYAADIDLDNNSAVDVGFGGTNAVSAFAARANLGLVIGTDVAAYGHAHSGTYEPANATILKSANIGVSVQAYDADLATLAAPTAWRLFYSNGTSVITELALGSAGTALISSGASSAPYWDVVAGSGGGTIGGSLGGTDNVIVRSDGAGGVTAQGSLVTLSDTGNINIPTGQTYQINGVAHTHNYQPADSDLTTWAGITPSANDQSLVALANYAAMLTALGGQPLDTDLTALAGLSGVRGDILYRDATQWQRLAKGTSGQVLKMGASDPLWGADLNDGGTGISRWDELGDPTSDTTIDQGGLTTTFTSTYNSSGAVWTFTNTRAANDATLSFFDMKYTSNGDAEGFFMRGYDNTTDLKWSIGPEGAFYGYSFETAQAATGGVFDLLEGSGNGTDYIRFKADDDVGTNRKLTLSTSVADSENLTIVFGANDDTVTIGSGTGAKIVLPVTTVTTLNGHTFTAGSSTFTGTAAAVYTFPGASATIAGVTAPIALASQAAGDTFYATSGTAIARLPKGTSGQLLAMKADVTGPEWIAPPAGTGDFKADGTVPMTGSLVGTVVGASNLGSATAELGNIFIGDGKIIYGQADQSATLTSGAGKFTANAFAVTGALTAASVNGHTFTAGTSTFTGTAGQTYTFPATTASLARSEAAQTFTGTQTFGTDIVLTSATAGARLTGGNGTLTIKGEGDGQDESLTFDFNTTANKVTVSSATGVTDVSLSGLNLVTTGTISGKIPMITKSDNYTLGTDDAQEAYGYMIWMSGANKTLTLPAVAAGMSGCLYSTDAEIKRLDPNASDGLRMGAARDTDGDAIASTAAIGAFVCFVADGADGWTILGKNGTWTAE